MPDALPGQLKIHPIPAFDASVRIPGSKSLTNRALLLAALAEGNSRLRDVLFADDTRFMLDALQKLGAGVQINEAEGHVAIAGCGGAFPKPSAPIELFLGNAGTAMRPLAAACTLGQGVFTLAGAPRMHERPIRELVEPLLELGASIDYLQTAGYPPLRITATGLRGGAVTMRPTLSSQFITALLIASPLMRHGLTIEFEGPITSRPYVEMTARLMAQFGGQAQVSADGRTIKVGPGGYQAADYRVEPDASNATYFLAAGMAVPSSRCTVVGLSQHSLQGDAGFLRVLEAMGAWVVKKNEGVTVAPPPSGKPLRGVSMDLNSMPDAAMTLATLAVLAQGPTTIRNIGNWRVKETDRMAAMETELTKLGARVTVAGDDITITPPIGGKITPASIDTYDDHRMAMSFAVIGLAQPGITLNDPACVNKTFPTFWEKLNELGPAVDLHQGITEPSA